MWYMLVDFDDKGNMLLQSGTHCYATMRCFTEDELITHCAEHGFTQGHNQWIFRNPVNGYFRVASYRDSNVGEVSARVVGINTAMESGYRIKVGDYQKSFTSGLFSEAPSSASPHDDPAHP